MIRIAYARQSAPSARKLQEIDNEIELYESSEVPVDVNWGRRHANSELNPDISNSVNKRRMRELFALNEVPTPKLYTPEEAALFVRGSSSSGNETLLIGRPDRHTQGRAFWPISSPYDLRASLLGTRRKRAATHFMEYIEKARAPREYRVHIFQGRVIRLSEKQPDDSERGYTTVPATHNVNHVRQAAQKALKAVGLDFGAVDILAGDTECWVLEVNSAPGLGGTMPQVYANVFNRWKEEYGRDS